MNCVGFQIVGNSCILYKDCNSYVSNTTGMYLSGRKYLIFSLTLKGLLFSVEFWYSYIFRFKVQSYATSD